MATKKDVYDELKRQMPKVMDNLEATVNTGAQRDEILSKCKEFTACEVPENIWDAISMAIDYLVLKRNVMLGQN